MADTAAMATVPPTLDAAMTPAWLRDALAPFGGGAAVTAVERVEVLRTVATKIRFTVRFEGEAAPHALCLKGLFDVDAATARAGSTCVREADFYGKIAGRVATRTPSCVARVVDRDAQQAVVIMADLVAAGARFCSALEPFTADEAAASVEQIAMLHAGSGLLDEAPWIVSRLPSLASPAYVEAIPLQALLDGPRGRTLSSAVRDADRLVAGLRALTARDAARRQFLIHGDAHAGNIYRTADGFGLIDWQLLQRGGWALDIAYHLAAVLPVAVAEREERALLDHYCDVARGLGCTLPAREEAWRQYRESVLYGYYLWAMTRRVEPAIIDQFVGRLGAAVERHDSHALLGVAPA